MSSPTHTRLQKRMLKTTFLCNKCGMKNRVKTLRAQTLKRCLCGEVFRVTKDGYEFLNHLPDPRTVGLSAQTKAMIADGRIILASR